MNIKKIIKTLVIGLMSTASMIWLAACSNSFKKIKIVGCTNLSAGSSQQNIEITKPCALVIGEQELEITEGTTVENFTPGQNKNITQELNFADYIGYQALRWGTDGQFAIELNQEIKLKEIALISNEEFELYNEKSTKTADGQYEINLTLTKVLSDEVSDKQFINVQISTNKMETQVVEITEINNQEITGNNKFLFFADDDLIAKTTATYEFYKDGEIFDPANLSSDRADYVELTFLTETYNLENLYYCKQYDLLDSNSDQHFISLQNNYSLKLLEVGLYELKIKVDLTPYQDQIHMSIGYELGGRFNGATIANDYCIVFYIDNYRIFKAVSNKQLL